MVLSLILKEKKIGIPVINENWIEVQDSQYSIVWRNPDLLSNSHFKKVIEYGIINPKSELDFYRNSNVKRTHVWSKYSYENNDFEYYIEKPNSKLVETSENGSLIMTQPMITEKISKLDFEKFITQ